MAYNEFPKDEAAKWSAGVDEAIRKMAKDRKAALSEAAAAGFDLVPGTAMEAVTEAAVVAKLTMTQLNGKIYGDGLQIIEKAEETDEKVAFGFAKLDMQAYRAQIENALDVEKAEADYGVETQRARVERLKSDVERGQVAIIQERAAIEQEIDEWRLYAIAAEDDTLDAEVDLANEKVRTAQAKLAIIEHLYAVIAAEELVLGAERRKAIAMEELIAAEALVVEAKRGLIPQQRQKAAARIEQAEAIRSEAEVRRDIEELGYDKIAVKQAEDAAEHAVKQAELTFETARLLFTRADLSARLFSDELKTALMAYQNVVRRRVTGEKAALDQEEKIFRLDYQHLANKFNITNDASYLDVMRALAITEANEKLEAISGSASERVAAVLATQTRSAERHSVHHESLYISKGE